MIYPTVDELTKQNHLNRYELVIGVAKCARLVTNEYVRQRDAADRMIKNRETDKSMASLISSEYRDQKAVKIAINRLDEGRYKLSRSADDVDDVENYTVPSENKQ